jgi:hypothetical protein
LHFFGVFWPPTKNFLRRDPKYTSEKMQKNFFLSKNPWECQKTPFWWYFKKKKKNA